MASSYAKASSHEPCPAEQEWQQPSRIQIPASIAEQRCPRLVLSGTAAREAFQSFACVTRVCQKQTCFDAAIVFREAEWQLEKWQNSYSVRSKNT